MRLKKNDRLVSAVKHSFRAVDWMRKLNRELILEYTGSGYGGNSDRRREVFMNVMMQAVDAYTITLAANNPQILMTTEYPELRVFAKRMQVAMNNLIKEIGLKVTLRRALLDAFFSMGIVRLHMRDSKLVEIEDDVWMDVGSPFVSNVSIEDFVYDVGATKKSECRFMGHKYRMDYEKAVEIFGKKKLEGCHPTTKYSQEDQEAVRNISLGGDTDGDDIMPMIDLADIYVRADRMTYTYVVSGAKDFIIKGEPIDEQEWTGSEHGPYPILTFNDVPENIAPVSPGANLATLSRNINNSLRKQAKMARDLKILGLVEHANQEDAQKIRLANNGDIVPVKDPKQAVGAMRFNGPDQALHVWTIQALNIFNEMAGNPKSMLGLGPASDTVGQEKLIHAAGTRREASLQHRMVDFTVEVVEGLGQLLWEDEFTEMRGVMNIPGADGYYVNLDWSSSEREGNLLQYNFDIDPYSMAYKGPNERLGSILQIIQQVTMPLYQQLREQGGDVDVQKLHQEIADLMDEPRIREIIKFSAPPDPEDQATGPTDTLPKPGHTTREYIRRNVGSGAREDQQAMQMQDSMLSQMGSNSGDMGGY